LSVARDLDHQDVNGDVQLVDHAFDDDARHPAALAILASKYLHANRGSSLGRHLLVLPSPGELQLSSLFSDAKQLGANGNPPFEGSSPERGMRAGAIGSTHG